MSIRLLRWGGVVPPGRQEITSLSFLLISAWWCLFVCKSAWQHDRGVRALKERWQRRDERQAKKGWQEGGWRGERQKTRMGGDGGSARGSDEKSILLRGIKNVCVCAALYVTAPSYMYNLLLPVVMVFKGKSARMCKDPESDPNRSQNLIAVS